MEKGKAAAKLKSVIKGASDAFLSALFPEGLTCDLCDEELSAPTRYSICADCVSRLPLITGRRCLVCGSPIGNEADYCIRCQNSESRFKLNRSPLVYDGLGAKLVLDLKFGGKRYIAKTLGAMMSDTYLSCSMAADVVVPVPMSKGELKRRGFNQAELLAREVGKRLGLPVLPALTKNRDTAPQKELGGKERAENLTGVFAVVFKEIYGLRVLLVDDVFTTGATANECALALFKARAREVSVLTAAVTRQKLPMEQA